MATAKKTTKQRKQKKAEPAKQPRKQWDKAELEKKKRYAYELYTEHRIEQNTIAEITGISEPTISKWKKDEDWDSDRQAMNLSPEQMMRRQLRMLDTLLTHIESRTPPKNIPSSTETDSINKLSDSIKKLRTEIGLGYKNAVGKQYIRFCLATMSKEGAIEEMKRYDEFLNSDY